MTGSRENLLKDVRERLRKTINEEVDAKKITGEEVLVIVAYITGACIAMQDQRTMTPERAMHLVALNIEAGNQEVLNDLKNTKERLQ